MVVAGKAPNASGQGKGKKKKKAKSRKTRASNGILRAPSGGGGLLQEYMLALADPFNHIPPKLGWGCLVPTMYVTAYQRLTYGLSTNTIASAVILPCVTGGYFAGTGTSTATLVSALTGNSAYNVTQVNNVAGEGRVVCSGLRATFAGPATSSWGFAYGGALTPSYWLQASTQGLSNLSVGDLAAIGQAEVFNPALGQVVVTGRPVDPDSYTFLGPVVDTQGWTTATNQTLTMPFQVPYITWSSLSASSSMQCTFEIVQHIEVTPPASHGNPGIVGGNEADSGPTLSDYFPSFETMYRVIRQRLPDAVSQIRSSYVPGFMAGMAAPAALLVPSARRRMLLRA